MTVFEVLYVACGVTVEALVVTTGIGIKRQLRRACA